MAGSNSENLVYNYITLAFYLFSKNVDSQHQKETLTNLHSINSSLEELGEVVLTNQICMPFPNTKISPAT